MSKIHDVFASKVPALRAEVKGVLETYGDKKISDVDTSQVFGGQRGVTGMICTTSLVDPIKGLIVRGIPILDLSDRLCEEIIYLLMTGEMPDKDALADLRAEIRRHAEVPEYVWKTLAALPDDTHPMTSLSIGILAMQRESNFKAEYDKGIPKTDYWQSVLDDALMLIGRVPTLAAGIYRMRFKKGPRIAPDPNLDWGSNYAHMLGVTDDKTFMDYVRLYLVLHCDHEGGNVSAFTNHVVSSALSDLFLSTSAGLNGLAGPLHGLANQECLRYILGILDHFGGVPTDEQLVEHAWDTLKSGRVIPGYGHAVLRATDPRFLAFLDFGKKCCSDSPVFQLVEKHFKLVPKVLQEHGKAKNPWPNVDAASGALLYHYGLKEFDYYTVLFGVSRVMGMCAQVLYARTVGSPIVRPKSIDWEGIQEFFEKGIVRE